MLVYAIIVAVLGLVVAVAHSVLGEKVILGPLYREQTSGLLAARATRDVIRAVFHVPSLAWAGLGIAVLVNRLQSGSDLLPVTAAIIFALSGIGTPVLGAVSKYNRKRMKAPTGGHPYLTGVHKPMTEEVTLADLKIDGDIPAQLDGRYLRIGPNPVTAPDEASYHWFTGDGMAHGIRIQDGKAKWYRNRWIRSNAVSDALGEPRKPGTRKPRTDTANTNIVSIAGKTFAIVEAGGFPVELTDDLETVKHNPFDGTLVNAFSAHPHLDPETGEMHAICYDAPVMDKVWHVVLGADGKVKREEPIAVKDGPSIHDCQITENYVLVFDLPATSRSSQETNRGSGGCWADSLFPTTGIPPMARASVFVRVTDRVPIPCGAMSSPAMSITRPMPMRPMTAA